MIFCRWVVNVFTKDIVVATIKDVARMAGVSIGTVDRILHNRGRFAPETARIVRQAVRDLNYTPDIRARNLSLSRNCRIAILMPDLEQDSDYWRLPFQGMSRSLDELAASHVSAEFFHFDRYKRESYLGALERASGLKFDGYIVSPLLAEETLGYFNKLFEEKPVVFFDTDIEGSGRYSFVGQNSKDAGHLAAKLINLLVGTTEKKVLVITPDTENEHLLYRIDGFFEKVVAQTTLLRISASPEKLGRTLEELRPKIADEIAAVYVTDSSSHRIAKIIEEVGMAKKVALVGFDMVPPNIDYLQKEVIDFILTQRPIDQGYFAVRTIYRKVMLGQDSSVEQFVPIDIITQENLATFLQMRDYL